MNSDFKDQVALVTGGSGGIGSAVCEALGFGGARVIVAYRQNEKAAMETCRLVEDVGGSATAVSFDVVDSKACKGAVDDIVTKYGRLDVLVNTAGLAAEGLSMRIKDSDWQQCLDVNLSGVFYLCRAAIRPMLKQRSGSIVNVSSVVARTGNAGQSAYSAAKGGVVSLTLSLAREVSSRGIRVNAVSPGWIETEMTSSFSDERRSELVKSVPLCRPGEPGEVADAVAFLASKRASYITGHVLDVNGGIYM